MSENCEKIMRSGTVWYRRPDFYFWMIAAAGLLFRLEYLREFSSFVHFDCAIGPDVQDYHDRALGILAGCGGLLKGFLYRATESDVKPKYLASPGLDRASVFFNMPEKSSGRIVVMEGEMDVLSSAAAGMQDAVAIGGSEVSGDRRRQVEDAFRRGVGSIVLFLDLDASRDGSGQPDYAGRYRHVMASVHTVKDVRPDFEDIYVVCPDIVCDPDSYIRERGQDEFLGLVAGAVPYWRYLYDHHMGL